MPINLDMTCISAIKEATLLELRQQGIYPSYHDFDIVKSYFTDSLEARIVSYFRSEKVVEESHTVSVRTPATWWDAFKAAHFPAWLLARYPVKFEIKSETVLFTQKAVYPEFAKHFADSGGSVYCIEIEKQLLNSSPNYTHA